MLLQLAIVIFQTTGVVFCMGSSDKYIVLWRSNVKMAEAREEALDISFEEMCLEGKYSSSMSFFCLLSLLAAFH